MLALGYYYRKQSLIVKKDCKFSNFHSEQHNFTRAKRQSLALCALIYFSQTAEISSAASLNTL